MKSLASRRSEPRPSGRPRSRFAGALVLALGVLVLMSLCGCGGDELRVEKTLGAHRVSFVVPVGWEHFDQGKQQSFEHERDRIVIVDLGLRRPPKRGGATLDEWLEYDLTRLDTATQRGIAARDSFERDAHTFYVFDTWDRLTHEYRRRHVIVPNQGRHLAIYQAQGDWEDSREGFESLLESLRILEPEAASDEPGGSSEDEAKDGAGNSSNDEASAGS